MPPRTAWTRARTRCEEEATVAPLHTDRHVFLVDGDGLPVDLPFDGGSAVNAPAFVNIPFGRSLTQVAELPAGSQRHLADPFVEKRSRAPLFITVLVLLGGGGAFLWKMGWLTLPGS